MTKRDFTDDSADWFDTDESDLLGSTTTEGETASLEENVWFIPDGGFAYERTIFSGGDIERECEHIDGPTAAAWLNANDHDVPEDIAHFL